MVKVEVIEAFTLGRYDELKNIKRRAGDKPGWLYVGDTFECTQDLADYLLGGNALNKAFIKILEVIPELVEEKFVKAKKEPITEPVVELETEPKKKRKSKK